MTEGVISEYITPSAELQRDDGTLDPTELLDEVDLYNLYDDRHSPEQDAKRILDITYPTETLTTVIEHTARALNSETAFTEGGQIIGGEFGSGKSHIELVLYHLFATPELGQRWLNQQDIDVALPTDARTAALQMFNLDREYNLLSEAVKDYLDIDAWDGERAVPTVHQIRNTLEGRPTLVLIDEFERWFGMSGRQEYQDDNLAFLQNLLEAAGRDDTRLSVFVSLLYENSDVQAITQRTNPFTHDLTARRDEKLKFILHRLVGTVDDPAGVASIAKEYTDVYRQNEQVQLEDYQHMQDRIEQYYPFHPLVLDLLMEKYSEQRVSSDARGLLRFLAEILRDTYNATDLILTSNIDVYQYTDRFQYIDTELVGKYVNDYHRLQDANGEFEPLREELLNIVLLHSLASGGDEGANKRQMLLGTLRKGVGAHRVIQTFTDEVYGHAWHVHRINGEYAFDTEENPAARIEKKAEDIHKHDAIHRVESLVREDLYDDHNNVYILDPINTEQEIPDNKTLKIVVSLRAKRSYDEEFEALTTGQEREFNNTIVLVTPEKRASVDTNTGIIELARKVVAGEQLKREEEVLPEGFEEIHDQNYQNLRDRVRDKFGTVYRSTERGLFPQPLSTDANPDFYTATTAVITPDSSQLRSEILESVKAEGASGIRYEFLRNEFHRNIEHTTLTSEDELTETIESLCRDGKLKVGSYFEERVGSLGNETTLVHEQYVEPQDDSAEETGTTITVDTTETTQTTNTTHSDTAASGSAATSSGGSAVAAFRCPQCGRELTSTTCECGFEFDASDIENGSVSIEGASTADLLDAFDELKEDTPTIRPHPPVGAINADNKPELIDHLEREIGIEWDIHKATIDINGTLTDGDLAEYGFHSEELADNISLEQTFELTPPEPLSKQAFLSLLWDLTVPEQATLAVQLQVAKNE